MSVDAQNKLKAAPLAAILIGGLPGWIAAVERLLLAPGTSWSAVLHGLGDAAAILGMSLFAASLVLMLRVGWLERLLGGLDSLYLAHHLAGALAFLVLLLHPVTLALRVLIENGAARVFDTTFPNPAHAGEFLGWVTLIWLMAMMLATFQARLSYVGWKWLHASAGIAFLFGTGHLLLVQRTSDWAMPLLALWILAGLGALVWRLLIDRGVVAGRRFVVEGARDLGEGVVELTLRPLGRPLAFRPGQFVFAAFYDTEGYRGCAEYHPFTIASAAGDPALRLVVKALGDCTSRMQRMRPGVPVRVHGPFGAFWPEIVDRPQVWIAGGIGIAPFLSMAAALAEEGPPVSLYYGAASRREATGLPELERIAARRSRLTLVPMFADRGELPGVDRIAAETGSLTGAEYFICGPAAMVTAVSRDLQAGGVAEADIHIERLDFR
ncbi:ferric reductase-like transmembrane domain-containing protein [Dongia sp.]|uniref:ferredoxin reductase family protein n=1 Tax=Dongia sp. TaxID=1977262 RepID=UPI00375257D4